MTAEQDTDTAGRPRIQQAGSGLLDQLSRVFARAFADDPLIRWPLADVADPRPALEACFRAWNAGNFELGLVYEVAGGAGFAVWVLPELSGPAAEVQRQARPAIHALTDDHGVRYERLWDWVDERMPAEPFCYLDQLGVDPSRQGEGLGRALAQFVLERAAQAGVPTFLETARERNLGFYSSLGFRVVDEGVVPDGGPRIWFMRCDPPR